MECYDCHNRSGIPSRIRRARSMKRSSAGRIDRGAAEVKARAEALITAAGDLSGPRKERRGKVDELIAARR